jgi:acetolactate synthase I/II/III large subunit
MTCGELLVQLLESLGTELVFGIPGVHTVELYRGLPATRIRHVTPRHEQGAGFMADGYARVTGKPGVCFIITGPGMTNILTAMAQAYSDSVPMLVISSVNEIEQLGLGSGRLHELPSQRAMTAGATVFSHTLMRPDELPQVLARAFAVFYSARPGPVHIELPLNVITAPAAHVSRKLGAIPTPPAPAPDAIEQAMALLRRARSPVVLVGGGAVAAHEELAGLVEALDAPTALTVNAKGLLPPGHPLSLGSFQSMPAVRELIATADVVLAIGTELGETDYDAVAFDGRFRLDGTLIRIDIDPQQLHRNYVAEVPILADARLAIRALHEQLLPRMSTPGHRDGSAPSTARRVAELRERVQREVPAHWRPEQRLLQIVQEALPGVIIAGDSTQPVYAGNLLYEAQQPRSWFNSATGYGTLGYGLPAAIGAKLAAPHRPVVALVGDGGLQFTVAELASAVEAKAGIIVLLWNNYGYSEIKRYMQQRGIEPIGVDIHTPDFLALARGFGCRAERASAAAQLRELLQAAAATDYPTVIEVVEGAAFLGAG